MPGDIYLGLHRPFCSIYLTGANVRVGAALMAPSMIAKSMAAAAIREL